MEKEKKKKKSVDGVLAEAIRTTWCLLWPSSSKTSPDNSSIDSHTMFTQPILKQAVY